MLKDKDAMAGGGFDTVKIKIVDINQVEKPEMDNWDNPIDKEITFQTGKEKFTVVCKPQIRVKEWNKQFKVVEYGDTNIQLTNWNGFRTDFVPIIKLFEKAGNEVAKKEFNLNGLVGFEFDGQFKSGVSKKTDKPYAFIDWTVTLLANDIEVPEPTDKGVYIPDDITVNDAFKELEEKEVETKEDKISDEDLPF
jgi:hypothetical protein